MNTAAAQRKQMHRLAKSIVREAEERYPDDVYDAVSRMLDDAEHDIGITSEMYADLERYLAMQGYL
jgi:tartrate dehydratase alpha subunit/fumarate hydratase class I-like protein